MIKKDKVKYLLKSNKLRVTNSRIDIIQYFFIENQALSLNDLEKKFDDYDKTTLYRNLNTLLKYGILHKIPNNKTTTYGINNASFSFEEHIHFKCDNCEQILCIDNKIPDIKLPQGYTIKKINLIAEGLCTYCSQK